MTALEAYQFVQNRLNRLSTNYGDNIPKYQFVEAFNAAQLHWCEDRFKVDQTNITRKDELQRLIVNTNINQLTSKNNYYEISLPENYFHYIRSVSLTPCPVYNFLKKEGDINRLLLDEFWKPSLEWQETICTIKDSKLRIYVDNFTIQSVDLTYYRFPVSINLNTGFPDVNNVPTFNQDPEFTGSSLLEILNLTCQIISGDTSDQWNYQVHTQRNQQHT
jgi:hypothetical protein